MTKFQQLTPDGNDWMVRELATLRAEIDELRAARSGEAMAIGSNGITIRDDGFLRMIDDNDKLVVYLGPDAQGRQVFRLLREGGRYVMYTDYAGVGAAQFWALTDREARVLVSDDALAGKGMARPWLPVYLSPTFVPSTPTAGNAGTWCIDSAQITTEVGLWEGRVSIDHPYIQVSGVWGHASGTGTVTYRLKIGGITKQTWTASTGTVSNQNPVDVTDMIGADWATIQITAQQSSGTGAVRCHVLGCYLTQTQ